MKVQKYTAELYTELAKDPDFPINYHVTGSVRLAHSEERMAEFKHVKSMARANGMEYDVLTPSELQKIYPFVETHDREELERALELDAKLVGVNARDLSTFETDRNLFGSLVELFPAGVIKVAESAVRNADDVAHYRSAGADVVLVGEALVTNDPAKMLQSFLLAGKS